MPSDVKDTIRRFILDDLEWPGSAEQLSDEFSLVDEGVLDSLNLLEMAHFVQSHYRIRVDEEDIVASNFETLTAIEAFVLDRLGTASPQSSR
ncbi:hypothetical protein AB0D32_01070 [Micromonospora sp. NPDC048170]|uniref:hypothetical protein n=1 Tax=Micromonospora sp. NPDC048170 TaxID=3154819 RepID=UPI0033DDB9E7